MPLKQVNRSPEPEPQLSLWDRVVELYYERVYYPLRDWLNGGKGPPPTRPA